jgi:hypothetical protein
MFTSPWAPTVVPRALLLLIAAVAILVARPATARAESLHLKVRGTARITAHASRDQGDLILSGALSDDAGQPLGGEQISIKVARESDPHDAKVAAGLRAARGCDRGADRPPTAFGVRVVGPAESPEILVITDEGGRFCFRASLVPDRHHAHLDWKGNSLVDPVASDIAFDLSRQAVVLRFDPTPRIVSLDEPHPAFEVTAILDDDEAARVAPALPLVLASERGELGRATTDISGRARWQLEPRALGPPGPGELRVSFAGNADVAFASYVAPIERHVKVSLRVPALERGELSPQVPEDGIALVVDVASSAGPVSEGGVEARIGDALVGSAPVERGLARLTLTFAGQGTEALVRLRYVPSAPWFEPLGDTSVRVPIRGPGLLAKAPILLAGIAVLVFFLVGRASSRQRKPEPAAPKPDDREREGKPRIDVVREAPRGETGWTGRLVDAHEGTPIAGGRVWVERGSFEGRTMLTSASTDADGRFTLEGGFERVGDEQLAAEARLHARLVQPLPPAGELSIALLLRRRALLQRLVAWAKRAGAPFDARPEPTPGHVKRAAGEDFQTARWADAIERTVYGEGEVDARAEGEIERLGPSAPGRPADDRPDDDRR